MHCTYKYICYSHLFSAILNLEEFRSLKVVFTILLLKEVSFCHKLKFSNPYIFATCWCKPLIFQTWTILSNIVYSLKYQRSKNIEFVTEAQFFYNL